MKKRILAILLSLLMIASIIPAGMITASAVSGDEIVAYARQFVGYPYVYGTKGPNSFDCSGLVYYVFKHFGISLPWGTSYIWNNPTAYGTIVGTGSVANAKPGDVISWSGHVAIYSGNGYCIQALNPSYGVTDKVKVNSYSLDGVHPNTNYRVLRIYGVDDNPYFDVNAKVDGAAKSTTDGVATFDVYINGKLVKDNVTNYYVKHPKGTKYEIKDIQIKGCYEVVGADTVSGTHNSAAACVLEFRTKHTLNDGVVTTEPTCTVKGVKTVSCVNCSYTSVSDVEPLGHDYKETRLAPTCTENAKYVSICSRCNDSSVRVVNDEDVWSDWSEEKPDNGYVTESKTQYRYMQSETKLTTEAELAGWTLVGKKWGEGKQSTVSYVTSFPAGFSKNHSLYTKYNITPPVSSENETKKVVVGSASTSGYIYWHWCSSKYNGNSPINRLISDCYEGWNNNSNRPYDVFHAFYSTTYKTLDSSAGAINYSNSSACNQTYWWISALPVKSVPVTTYEMMYEYIRETEWGEWTDTAPTDDSVKYETREVYRYSDSTDLATGHKWDDEKVVNNEKVYTCTVCSETKTEVAEPPVDDEPDIDDNPEVSDDFVLYCPEIIEVGDKFVVEVVCNDIKGTESADLSFEYNSEYFGFESIRVGDDANFSMSSSNSETDGVVKFSFVSDGAITAESVTVAVLEFTALKKGNTEFDVIVEAWSGKEEPDSLRFDFEIEESSGKYIIGDVNCDGKVNAIDARIILRISAQLDKITNYEIPEAVFDLTGDGKVNALDARKALRIGAQLE